MLQSAIFDIGNGYVSDFMNLNFALVDGFSKFEFCLLVVPVYVVLKSVHILLQDLVVGIRNLFPYEGVDSFDFEGLETGVHHRT